MCAFLFLNALYLQNARHLPAFTTGLLVSLTGTRLPPPLSGVGLVASALLLTRLQADTPLPLLLCAYVLFGLGFGLVNAPITNTAVSGMPRARAGSAAATVSTSRQVGVSLGVALAGTIVGAAKGDALGGATHPMWCAAAGCWRARPGRRAPRACGPPWSPP